MTEKAKLARCWKSLFKRVGGGLRQIRDLIKLRDVNTSFFVRRDEVADATLPGKVAKHRYDSTVP